jgi:predicted ABC-type ATPase
VSFELKPTLPQILILLGPNGVGKTTIGQMLQTAFECEFVSIELFFMQHYPSYEEYRQHRQQAYLDFEQYLRALVARAEKHPLVFEEVGASEVSFKLISNLQRDYRVSLVSVMASEATCLERVKARGSQANFPKSPGFVLEVRNRYLNETFARYQFSLTLENEGLSLEQVAELFRPLLGESL